MPRYCDGTTAPSYLLVSEENSNVVLSRWWVIGSQLQRNGQARLSLLRDIIADFRDEILAKPMFIRKGWINSLNDPAILNDEDMTFNQIKKEELPIKDKSEAAWYVGYLNKSLTEKSFTIPSSSLNVSSPSYSTESAYPYSQYNASNPFVSDNYSDFIVNFYCYARSWLGPGKLYVQGWDNDGNAKTPWVQDGYQTDEIIDNMFAYGMLGKDDTANPRGIPHTGGDIRTAAFYMWERAQQDKNWQSKAKSLLKSHTSSEVNTLLNEDGKVYQIGSTFKKVRVYPTTIRKTVNVSNGDVFAQTILAYAASQGGFDTTNNIFGSYTSISYQTTGYVVALDTVSDAGSMTFSIPSNRAHLTEEAFDMFAIPATELYWSGPNVNISPDLSRRVVAKIIEDLPKGEGGSLLYDVQLVPYCPFPDYIFTDVGEINTTKIANTETTINFVGVGNPEEAEYSVILFASSNEFRKTVFTNPIAVPQTSSLDFKVSAQTKKYRLVSPNYNGQFEFSAEKNNGVQGWNIDFTYKPYQPYIRVAPIFGRLYGRDFGDARGLICGGDFSITQTNDAWEQYQLNNKNYQAIFDRQITSMEVSNSVQREQERFGRITGTISGGVSGAMAGGMIGGMPAAIGMGLISGLASGWGGAKDLELNERLRQDAITAAYDQFGYQLQQIQALPYSLNKVGVQNVNYKYFPFVEIYECTPEEMTALTNKIQWNGMTIMRIGTIADHLKNTEDNIGTFIQAKPLRISTYAATDEVAESITNSAYFLDVITAELEQGVYYK